MSNLEHFPVKRHLLMGLEVIETVSKTLCYLSLANSCNEVDQIEDRSLRKAFRLRHCETLEQS